MENDGRLGEDESQDNGSWVRKRRNGPGWRERVRESGSGEGEHTKSFEEGRFPSRKDRYHRGSPKKSKDLSEVYLERNPRSVWSRINFTTELERKKADLQANIIYYIAQYARIIAELMRVKRIPEGRLEILERRALRVFRDCIKENSRAVRDMDPSICCVKTGLEGLDFDPCRELSRLLVANMRELHKMDSALYEKFEEEELNDKQISMIWNATQTVGTFATKQLIVFIVKKMLFKALQLDVLEGVFEYLGIDKYYAGQLTGALERGGKLAEQSIDKILGILSKAGVLSKEAVAHAASLVGGSFRVMVYDKLFGTTV